LPNTAFLNWDESRQDINLDIGCRNSRPVLVAAHALRFGIYRKPLEPKLGLAQMFDRSSLWLDIGYQIAEGELEYGKQAILSRSPISSLAFLESHSDIDDLIASKSFDAQELQDQWVAQEIERNLKADELRVSDITVINLDPTATKMAGSLKDVLSNHKIEASVALFL
jgi:superfamily I DNA and RNA helicase